jgi:hypothetical protein
MKYLMLIGLLPLLLTPSAPAQAAFDECAVQKWGPNGNGTLLHEDDLQWVMLHDTRITADQKAGIYIAAFSPMLLKMENQNLVITGYVLPLSATSTTTHFILTRRSPACPFCPPNEPTEAIEIFSQTFVKPTDAPITVEGRLHFVSRSEQGLFFRIESAKIW